MQVGRLSRTEGRRFHHPGRDDVVPAAGVRVVPEASRGGAAYRLHEAEAFGHRAARLQRGAGQDPEGSRSHPAGGQQMQAAVVQGLRRAVQGLHYSQVRARPQRMNYLKKPEKYVGSDFA